MEDSYIPRPLSDLYTEEVKSRSGREQAYFVLNPEVPAWAFVNADTFSILQLCDGRNSVAKIVNLISDLHHIPRSDAAEIVTEFLDRLVRNQVLCFDAETQRPLNAFTCLALEITRQCNLHCRHCYLDAGNRDTNELTHNEIRALFRAAKNAGATSTSIGGGEPLLRNDFFDILDSAFDAELLVSIGTNATLVDRALSRRLASHKLKIQVSLDGASPAVHDRMRGQGAFKKAVQGLDHLLSHDLGKDIVIAFTPTKLNFSDIDAIVEFGLERGIPVIQFPPLSPSGRAKTDWEELSLSSEEVLDFWHVVAERAEELKGHMDLLADCFSMNVSQSGIKARCSIGTQIRVDPTGDVFPCQCFHGGEDYCLGNVRKDGFEEIVAGKKLKKIIVECFERPDMIEECRDCAWKNFCGSGCMGSAYESTGTVLQPNACEARKAWIRNLLDKQLTP